MDLRLRAGLSGLVALATVSLALAAPWTVRAATSSPSWLSAQSAGGSAFDVGRAITATGGGLPVVAGNFTGSAEFPRSPVPGDAITLSSLGFNSAAFVAGMDADSEYFTWALRVVGSFFEVLPTAIAATGTATASPLDDTVLVTGFFQGTAYFPAGPTADDSIALTAFGTADAFIASVAPDGSRFEWARRIGPTAPDPGRQIRPRAISVDASGNATIFGDYNSSQTVEFPSSGVPVSLPGSGTYSAFVGRFAAATGDFAWVQRSSGSATFVTGGSQAGWGTASHFDDRPLMTGTTNPGTTYFPTGNPAPDDSLALTGGTFFVAAMNADDSYFAWVQPISGLTSSVIAGRPDGGLVFAGGYTGDAYFPRGPGDDSIALTSVGGDDAFVAQMSADDSYFDTAVSAGGNGTDRVSAVTATTLGGTVVAGDVGQSISFPSPDGPMVISNAGGNGAFVSQVAPSGEEFSWAISATGASLADAVSAYALASTADGRALLTGEFEGSVTFASSGSPLSLTGLSDIMVASIGPSPAPPPAASAPAAPASAPTSVAATPGDGSASVSWSAPSSSGSYPVSHYLVTASPGGRTCLVTAPTLTCEVVGLTNGTAYTFTVKALTGAGWSASSEPSSVVVPRAADKPSIVITGSREGQRIVVTGTAQGMGMGGMLSPWLRRAGQTSFAQGSATILVSMDGTFDWSRRSRSTVSVYVATPDGSMRSNTVRISAG